jgi:hypothetical protein
VRRIAALLVVLALSGCSLFRPARPGLPSGTTAAALLAGLDARRSLVQSVRARVKFRSGLAQVWARQAVLVQRPHGVRIDVLSPFGLALALGTDGETLWVYPPQERLRYEGAATPENLQRFFGAPVRLDDLVDVLLGLPPHREPSAPPRLVPLADGGGRVVVTFDAGEQRLDFVGEPLRVRRADELRDGRLALRIDFGAYEDGFPRELDVSAPDGSAARVRYVSVEPNVTIDQAVFRAPSATRVLPIEAIQVQR